MNQTRNMTVTEAAAYLGLSFEYFSRTSTRSKLGIKNVPDSERPQRILDDRAVFLDRQTVQDAKLLLSETRAVCRVKKQKSRSNIAPAS